MVSPLLLGVFLGAPLLARELETGTFRFVWTQGTSRVRLLLVKVVVLGAALSVLTAALTLLFDWWYRPWLPIYGRMGGFAYNLSGSVLVAQTLLAFTLGVLMGALTRRPVTAIAVAAVAWLAVVIATTVFVRSHLQAPINARAESNTITMHAITINQWITDPHGIRLTSAQTDRIASDAGPDLNRTGESFNAWLRQHGYTSWVSYQPENRYWRFQSIETLGYAAAATVLALGGLLYVRRKGWT